jgi:hypothetical protein
MRITALLTRLEEAEEMIGLLKRKAEALEAGVTLLYVREERLFELPLFGGREPSAEEIRSHLLTLTRSAGREEWAVLAYDDDPVDRLLLEADREHAGLLLTDLKGAREDLLSRTRIPVLFMEPGGRHGCGKGLIVIDPACSGNTCLSRVRRILEAAEWSAYMDDQIIPTVGSGVALDPVADTLAVEAGLEAELRSVHERAFYELCKAEGLEGYYEIGEAGIPRDILNRALAVGADCLAVIAEDHDTLLAEALGALAEETGGRDLLVCFQSGIR